LNDAYLGFRRHRRRSTEAGVMWRLGEFDDAEFWEIVAATEAPLEATDLFVWEAEIEFDWLERYDSGWALLEDVKELGRVPRPASPCDTYPQG
jgi:hypothetical protein